MGGRHGECVGEQDRVLQDPGLLDPHQPGSLARAIKDE